MLLWIKDAPELDLNPNNISKIVDFIDKYISCSLDVSDEKKTICKDEYS